MSQRSFYRLGGLGLIAGGLLAAAAHVLHTEVPSDPTRLAQYAHFSQPIHLLLFAGSVLVLLGWFGQFAFQSARCGVVGLLAFLSVFFGIVMADLLHCILEFSIFPLLIASVPYATPAFMANVYRSTPFAILQSVGRVLLLVGIPLSAISILRSRVLPAWSAVPMAITAPVMITVFLPWTSRVFGEYDLVCLYISMSILGLAVLNAIWRASCSENREQV